MTSSEIKKILQNINLEAISDEELGSLISIIGEFSAELKWIRACRRRAKSLFSNPNKK